jgi:hypothetical protein
MLLSSLMFGAEISLGKRNLQKGTKLKSFDWT